MNASEKRLLAGFAMLCALAVVVMSNGLRQGVARVFVSAALPAPVVRAITPDFVLGRALDPRVVEPAPAGAATAAGAPATEAVTPVATTGTPRQASSHVSAPLATQPGTTPTTHGTKPAKHGTKPTAHATKPAKPAKAQASTKGKNHGKAKGGNRAHASTGETPRLIGWPTHAKGHAKAKTSHGKAHPAKHHVKKHGKHQAGHAQHKHAQHHGKHGHRPGGKARGHGHP